ncbi:MAG: BON domain-containing protein [Chloroflexota bacterium]
MLSLFGKKYKDDEIMLCAENALELESMINSSNLIVVSEKGIVKLEGNANSEREKSRAMDAVLNSLQGARLEFAQIEDHIRVGVVQV